MVRRQRAGGLRLGVEAMAETTMTEISGFELDGRWYAMRKNGGWLSLCDVSHHQHVGSVDFSKYDAVYVRASHGRTPDETCVDHAKRVVDAGLPLGLYHFYEQDKDRTAQRDVFLSMLHAVKPTVMLAPAHDHEWNVAKGADGKYHAVPTEVARHVEDGQWLAEEVAREFGQIVIYTAPFFWRDTLKAPAWMEEYSFWLAHYTKPGWPSIPATAPPTMKHWAMHQFQGSPLDTSVAEYLPLAKRRDTDPAPPPSEES
jgi:GH25 family lysozyme M1 (1,4-beta-N-acetylmuramidase)